MRRTVRCGAMLAFFLLATLHLGAEPILRAFRVEPQSARGTATPVPQGKSLVLAQIFNPDPAALKAGEFEIGLELTTQGKTRVYTFKPKGSVMGGAMRTFPMIVPAPSSSGASAIRIFSRQAGKTIFADVSAGASGLPASQAGITTLYTEAPPEPDAIKPPPEVPFEIGSGKRSADRQVTAKVPAGISAPKNPKPAPATKLPVAEPAPASTRVISDQEFKTLRTIDEELVIYVFKKGDSLASVAEKYYGSSKKERTIADLNFIEDPGSVKVGEEIIVDVRPLAKKKGKKG